VDLETFFDEQLPNLSRQDAERILKLAVQTFEAEKQEADQERQAELSTLDIDELQQKAVAALKKGDRKSANEYSQQARELLLKASQPPETPVDQEAVNARATKRDELTVRLRELQKSPGANMAEMRKLSAELKGLL